MKVMAATGANRSTIESFVLDDSITVWCQIDFWMRISKNRMIIIDWKSGRWIAEDEMLQLVVYALCANHCKGYQIENVLVQSAHLKDKPMFDPLPVQPHLIDFARQTIRDSHVREMNMVSPVRKRFFARKEDFESSPSEAQCLACQFKVICPQGNQIRV
jgi:hypothetical protein